MLFLGEVKDLPLYIVFGERYELYTSQFVLATEMELKLLWTDEDLHSQSI